MAERSDAKTGARKTTRPRARLVAVGAPAPAEFALVRRRITVGSAPDNDLVIPAPTVSSHHAVIRRRFGRYVLSDLGSTNGTFVDGGRIGAPVSLGRGDEVRFGEVRFGLVAPRARGLWPVLWRTAAVVSVVFALSFATLEHYQIKQSEHRVAALTKEKRALDARLSRAQATAPPRAWLAQLNYYRSLVKLRPVVEDPDLSRGDRLHARYLVRNRPRHAATSLTSGPDMHTEDPRLPGYSPEGLAAAKASNVSEVGTFPPEPTSPTWAIAGLIEGPFHRLPMLNPRLARVGYGEFCKAGVCAAALNIRSGTERLRLDSASEPDPIRFPPERSRLGLRRLDEEWPNPLAPCTGYKAPSGLPITLQLRPGAKRRLTGYALSSGGRTVEACGFDALSYASTNPSEQRLARRILAEFGAIVVVPRYPLRPDQTYQVSITAGGRRYEWSFETGK